ncbi:MULTISPECIES: hypothetical protein [Methanosarcina]|uniref:Uncharacterized protein n=1 Tax=Methanosarcina mazei TaxID=2209 RepID=A0A0F8RLF0_METMZ|nr:MULTISPECIES: hypothetical protein [Methanosarcina]KKH55551.1 hypothetical protein DU74_03950 [Methanosarcina mazei]QIB91458.1 hypothetical protein FQU78_10740 [Methanosarcina mazei]
MAEIPSQISFSKLISNTFPGVFVTIGIFLVLYMLFSNYIDSLFSLLQGQGNSWATFIGAVGSLIFFATIVGILVDTLSHLFIETLIYKVVNILPFRRLINNKMDYINCKESDLINILKDKNLYKDVDDNRVKWFYFIGFLPIDKFIYIDENYYCYQECLFNLSLSFIFSTIIYTVFFYFSKYSTWIVVATFSIFLLLSLFCFYSGLYFYLTLRLSRIEFIKGALDKSP